MKKILVMAFALIIGSVAVYAQSSENALCLQTKKVSTAYCAHNQDVCTRCPVCEHGQLIYCEDLPEGSQRSCCYRQKPTGAKGDRSGKGGKAGQQGPSVYNPTTHLYEWSCDDRGAQGMPECSTPNQLKCCWKNNPYLYKGGSKGNKDAEGNRGGKGGRETCEGKLIILPIERRPLCSECSTSHDDGHGNKTIDYCENIGNNPQAEKRCCWRQRPSGHVKGNTGKGAVTKGIKQTPQATAPAKVVAVQSKNAK